MERCPNCGQFCSFDEETKRSSCCEELFIIVKCNHAGELKRCKECPHSEKHELSKGCMGECGDLMPLGYKSDCLEDDRRNDHGLQML